MSVEIENDVLLGPKTSIGVGGFAREYVEVEDIDDVPEALDTTLPIHMLGAGTNCLISDSGFNGRVIHIIDSRYRSNFVKHEFNDGLLPDMTITVRACAGMRWDALVAESVSHGFDDLACLSGIPGCVGAAPIQTIGAYGQSVSDAITKVRVFDREQNRFRWISKKNCRFGYRDSVFKTHRHWIVCEVLFHLQSDEGFELTYTELADEVCKINPNCRPKLSADLAHLDLDLGVSGDAESIRKAVLKIRARKSMLINPADQNAWSLGSFFKNPVISLEKLSELKKTYPEMPAHLLDTARGQTANNSPTQAKISAAWLIERAGYKRGHIAGNAGLSAKHALALINRGGATSIEVITLATHIYAAVHDMSGIALEPEIQFIGMEWQPGACEAR